MDLLLKNAKIPQGDRQVDSNSMVNNGEIVGFASSAD